MSDSIAKTEENTESTPKVEETAYVPKGAYEDVSKDMHKYKNANKELKASLNELQARVEADQRAKMEEKQQYEELYKKVLAEKEALQTSVTQERNQLTRQRKMTALKSKLGDIKDAYLNLADIDSIEVDETGSINSETLLSVVNSFKQEHPGLIPTGDAANFTSHAAPMNSVPTNDKEVKDMSVEELQALLRSK